MFWQIKAATRMTNWDAQTIIPSFDFLCCHCYQLDIWMKNQLRNFDPFKNRETNSVIRKSLEEYGTVASPYTCCKCGRRGLASTAAWAGLCLGPGSPGSFTGVSAPFWARCAREHFRICSPALLTEHTHPHGSLAILRILTKAEFRTDVSHAEMEMVEWPAVPNRRSPQ